MNFNEKLASYRKSKGLTQEQLAEQMQVSRKSVSKWETGEVIPDLTKVMKLSELLNVSIDELCGKEIPNRLETKQDIKLEIKSSPIKYLIITLIVAIICGICGYFIGQSISSNEPISEIEQGLPEIITIEDLKFYYDHGELRCEFKPSFYSNKYFYTMFVGKINSGGILGSPMRLANGICYGTYLNADDGLYQVFLLIQGENETREVMLANRIELSEENGAVVIQ